MQGKQYAMNLKDISTLPPKNIHKSDCKKELQEMKDELAKLQNKMYAQRKYSLLVILQGMDASGKDGLIKHVFTGFNPIGCKVHAFKIPTEEEAAHDFLWRAHIHTPEKGFIQVFNRSYYEDVLVTKVDGLVKEGEIRNRYEHINNFEKLLIDDGTMVLKFYLHISHKKQLKRLDERLSDETKKWKYNPEDMTVSKQWDDYQKAYDAIFDNCQEYAEWCVIPSDKKWYKEWMVARSLLKHMKKLPLEYPQKL
jgi:PPK2 family polyphosphate:nucleotide phosphotransferase